MMTVRQIYGLACPRCDYDETLDIQIFCMARVTSQGSEPFGDHEWDEDSFCRCPNCNRTGDVSEFRIDGGQS